MRAYGQKDPLVEYKRESHQFFKDLIINAQLWVVSNIFKVGDRKQEAGIKAQGQGARTRNEDYQKIGRNDPCWCGAKKSDGTPIKYKHCHGK